MINNCNENLLYCLSHIRGLSNYAYYLLSAVKIDRICRIYDLELFLYNFSIISSEPCFFFFILKTICIILYCKLSFRKLK